MIAHIQGKIVEKFANSVIIDVHGVGYEVALSSINYDNLLLNDEVKVYTYHLVREQSEDLFGFTSLAEKKLFELLISVQGVGPKNAMAILSLAPAEEVRNAIANADAASLLKPLVSVSARLNVSLSTSKKKSVSQPTTVVPLSHKLRPLYQTTRRSKLLWRLAFSSPTLRARLMVSIQIFQSKSVFVLL